MHSSGVGRARGAIDVANCLVRWGKSARSRRHRAIGAEVRFRGQVIGSLGWERSADCAGRHRYFDALLSPRRHCERSEAIQNLSAEGLWIASLRSQ